MNRHAVGMKKEMQKIRVSEPLQPLQNNEIILKVKPSSNFSKIGRECTFIIIYALERSLLVPIRSFISKIDVHHVLW